MREQSTRPVEQESITTHASHEQEAESETKFAGGKPPHVGGAFNDASGTATLAYEEDEHERELKQKVGALVASKYGGDYKKAFDHYDVDKNGAVGKSELMQLLSDAGVGNGITRGMWASKIIEKLDANVDKAIDWSEFETVFRAAA